MRSLLVATLSAFVFASSAVANDLNSEPVPTLKTFDLKDKVCSKQTFFNNLLFREYKFRPDGRLTYQASYSTKGPKEKEQIVKYDEQGNMVENIKYDYKATKSKQKEEKEEIVADCVVPLYEQNNEYYANHIVYYEHNTYSHQQITSQKLVSLDNRRNDYITINTTFNDGLKVCQTSSSHKKSGELDSTVWSYNKEKQPVKVATYRIRSKQASLASTTIYSYDKAGKITLENYEDFEDNSGSQTEFTYYKNGILETKKVISIRDGNKTIDSTLSYDNNGRLLNNGKTQYEYNKKGLLIRKSTKNTTTIYEYNQNDSLISKIWSSGNYLSTTRYKYNSKGVKIECLSFSDNNPDNWIEKFTYDNDGRLTRHERNRSKGAYASSDYVAVSYDSNGFAKVEEASVGNRSYSILYNVNGIPVSELKVLYYEDPSKIKLSRVCEFDSHLNEIKATLTDEKKPSCINSILTYY